MLPEALECWPIDLFRKLLPRHLEIIYEINARFLDEVRVRFLGDEEQVARLSLIDEKGARAVRMAQPGVRGKQRHQRGRGAALGAAETGRAARLP